MDRIKGGAVLDILSPWGDFPFWAEWLQSLRELGILLPAALTFLEAMIPALPLTAIVAFNVGLYGPFWAFLSSWAGACLGAILVFLFSRHMAGGRLRKWLSGKKTAAKIQQWISRQRTATLFLLICIPFAPSALINIAFGLSDFSQTRFIRTLVLGKLVMIGLLTLLGNTAVQVFQRPVFIFLTLGILGGLAVLSHWVKGLIGWD
jgi:uncharacterized membrane protein YdjX (TVP38/TMEM64 family)